MSPPTTVYDAVGGVGVGVAGGCVVALAAGVVAGGEVLVTLGVVAGEAVAVREDVAMAVGVGFDSPADRQAAAANMEATVTSSRTPYSARRDITS